MMARRNVTVQVTNLHRHSNAIISSSYVNLPGSMLNLWSDKDNTMQHIVMSKNEIVQEIRRLNVIERLNIVTDIWDEIKESQELETVSEEDRILLLNRLENYRKNPDSAIDWTELRQEIRDRYAEKS